MLGEATDHADPLRCGCTVDLLLEHAHGVGKRADAIPAQLHVVAEPTANDVHVAVDEAGDYAPAFEVHARRLRPCQGHDFSFASDRDEAAIPYRGRVRLGILSIESRELAPIKDQIGAVVRWLGLQVPDLEAGSYCAEPRNESAAVRRIDHCRPRNRKDNATSACRRIGWVYSAASVPVPAGTGRPSCDCS